MLVVRPAGPADLDPLLELAHLSGPGFTSLPEDPDALGERLDLSRKNEPALRSMTPIKVLKLVGIERPTNAQCKECAAIRRYHRHI